MATVKEISVRTGIAVQENVVSLDTARFKVRIVYNERVDRYFIDISTEDGTILIQGLKMVADWNPFRNILVENLPEGRVIVLNRLGTGESPGEDNLGFDGDCGLFYESGIS